MSSEIKIEKKASEVIQPKTTEAARQAIREKKDLSGADLKEIDLENLSATGAILRKTDLTGVNLSHGLLVNPNFFKAKAHQAALHHTVFLGGDLVRADFTGADLSDSALVGVDGQEACFEGANLRNAGLVSADLRNANFIGANLANSRLAGLNVEGADFSGADTAGARAVNVDWSKAKVSPTELPAPLIELPAWGWAVLVGSMVGVLGLLIYSLVRRQRRITS